MSSSASTLCPLCHKPPLYACDNDCGSYECVPCHYEYYLDVETQHILEGHAPQCGEINSDIEFESGVEVREPTQE